MYHCGMRQVGERHVPYQVDLMVWSNRLDLLALSNFKGEVQIHRLHWQKVWNLPAPEEDISVRAMAWRPDGKALAVGYSSGSVYIVDIEDKEVLDKYILENETADDFAMKRFGVRCITWAVRNSTLESATEYNLYDDASIFLQKLPNTSGYKNQASGDGIKEFKEIQEPNQLNMLLVGYGTGYIYMNIFGRYPYGTIHLAQVTKDDFGEYNILDINLSDDFSMMQVLYVDRYSNNLLLSLINTSVLSAFAEEMFIVANKYVQITQMLSYLDQTMTSITEAWEHILLEMDTKMAFYAASVPEGGVSADMMELLMLGTPTDELQLFLLQKLTANDLKKFGNSVELSYSTIQKLVLKQLNIVGQSLTYYLSELRGLTRIPDRYKILGITESSVTAAIKACCAFLNKSLELQQVIDVSMRNYKAFFRWLFVVIVRLLDEQTPSEIVKITQQELSHIAEFLYNFDSIQEEKDAVSSINQDKPVKFNLERLGQYLQDQDLSILPDDEDNPWHKFLKENSCLLKDNETIFSMSEFKKYSLVQQQKYLKDAIDKVFDVSQKDIGKYFSDLHNIRCYEDQLSGQIADNLRISQTFEVSEKRFMMAFMDTEHGKEGIYFMSVDLKENSCSATAMKYHFSSSLLLDCNKETNDEQIAVLDLQFYSSEYLSVLAKHPHDEDNTIFIQVPVKILIENANDFNIKSKSYLFCDKLANKDISSMLEPGVFKVLDKMDGYRIAVSGGRKVAIVLAKSARKVRVFEMEIDGDEEEEETLDTTPLSLVATDLDTSDKQNTTAEDVTFE